MGRIVQIELDEETAARLAWAISRRGIGREEALREAVERWLAAEEEQQRQRRVRQQLADAELAEDEQRWARIEADLAEKERRRGADPHP